MNAFLVALLASAVVLVSARVPKDLDLDTPRLNGRLLTPNAEDTLKTLLSVQDGSIGGGSNPVGQLKYNLHRDYERVNPRNPTSDWKWMSVQNGKYAADNGALIRDGISSTELVAIPFAKNAEDQSRLGLLSNYEAVLVNKAKFVVEPEHKLTVRAAFSVMVKNVEDHPFGKNAVTNATDDPSLACAGISLVSSGKGGLVFSIVATNTGIWAVYERNRIGVVQHPERGDKIFIIFHRLADRESTHEEIDAAITYDRSRNAVDFKLNNVVVYTLKNLGTLPKNELATVAHTITRPDLVAVEPKEFTVAVGIMSFMDSQDPNNQAHSLRGQRLTSEDVYDEKAMFVDETGNKMYNTWGQGAILKLHDIVIKVEKSLERDDKNEINGREGQKIEAKADGKLIVPSLTADLEELALITGERVPRINVQEGEEEESLKGQDEEDTPSIEDKKNKKVPKVRTGRRQDNEEETSSKVNQYNKIRPAGRREEETRVARRQEGEGEGEEVVRTGVRRQQSVAGYKQPETRYQ